MPRHHKRRHNSTKKHHKRHKSLSLKKVLTLINPPDSARVVTTGSVIAAANNKAYFEVGMPNTSYNYSNIMGDMFLSLNWIYKMFKINGTTVAPTSETWILKAYREVEFTNICNADLYLELNKFTSKKDWPGSDPLLMFNNILSNTSISNGPALSFNNDYAAPAPGVSPTLTTKHTFENLMDGFAKTYLSDWYHIVNTKEICLKPQQSVKVKLFRGKPFLFAPARTAGNVNDATLATLTNQQHYAHKTQAIVFAITGMTTRVAPAVGSANYYQSAPVSLQYTVKDYMRFAVRSNPVRAEAWLVINNGMSTSGNAIEFGADAIAGVAVT